jgi:hypothetical protein
MDNFFDDDRVDRFLLPKLLASKIVQSPERCMIGKCGGVCKAFGNDWRGEKAIEDDGRIARDTSILSNSEHESEMSMSSAPARSFDGCHDFSDLLPEMIDGGGRWLADNSVKRHGCDDGTNGLVKCCFVCSGRCNGCVMKS